METWRCRCLHLQLPPLVVILLPPLVVILIPPLVVILKERVLCATEGPLHSQSPAEQPQGILSTNLGNWETSGLPRVLSYQSPVRLPSSGCGSLREKYFSSMSQCGTDAALERPPITPPPPPRSY